MSKRSVLLLGDIKLVGGTYWNEGLVMYYHNYRWGTICNDDFDDFEASLLCQHLGYE